MPALNNGAPVSPCALVRIHARAGGRAFALNSVRNPVLKPVCLGALLALAALAPVAAQAACTETTVALTAAAGDDCTASHTAYTGGARALFADGAGAVITVPHAVTINAGGASAPVNQGTVAVGNGGTLNFQGPLTLTQNGLNNSYGLAAPDRAGGGGKITTKDVHITMGAGGATRRGVLALGTGGVVDIAGKVTIVANGAGAHQGLSAEDGGDITYESADIDLTGWHGSRAIRATSASSRSRITAKGKTTLKLDAANLPAVLAITSNIVLKAVDITVSNGAHAVLLREAGEIEAEGGTINVTGGGSAFLYASGTGNLAQFKDVTVTTDSSSWLWDAGAVVANFVGEGGSYTGKSRITAGTLGVQLTQQAKWIMTDDSSMTNLFLETGARLEVKDSHTLTLTRVESETGAIALTDGAANDTLTIDGHYKGGGALELDTVLGAGPAGADVLHVKNDVEGAGATRIKMNLASGVAGAATTGNGILVVQVDGDSPAGGFTLDGTVWHNGFLYELKQVGKNWYLQSRAAPNPAGSSSATPVPALNGAGLALLGAGLALGAALRRRRQQGA